MHLGVHYNMYPIQYILLRLCIEIAFVIVYASSLGAPEQFSILKANVPVEAGVHGGYWYQAMALGDN